MVKERQDGTGSNCLKGPSAKVTLDKKGIRVMEGVHGETDAQKINGIIGYRLGLKKNQQIASGFLK